MPVNQLFEQGTRDFQLAVQNKAYRMAVRDFFERDQARMAEEAGIVRSKFVEGEKGDRGNRGKRGTRGKRGYKGERGEDGTA